jgi:D-glycero-D-manno-heptose 1,7-bisphosphate phosphatase
VFLDRDGVLNEVFIRDGVPTPPRSIGQFRLLPGVAEACAALRASGLVLVVVTNQPDIARGTQTRAEVDRIHEHLRTLISPDDICVCPHDDADCCACRKPRPGMLLEAAERLNLDLSRSVCVGDRWRDIEAAQRAGVRSVHIECNYGEKPVVGADAVAASLLDAMASIRTFTRRERDQT